MIGKKDCYEGCVDLEKLVLEEFEKKREKINEYQRKYYQRPYVKVKRKAYNELPGMKEKVKQYNKEYYQRRKKEKNDNELEKISLKQLYTSRNLI